MVKLLEAYVFDKENSNIFRYKNETKWRFIDETSDEHGPFETKIKARNAFRKYVVRLNGKTN